MSYEVKVVLSGRSPISFSKVVDVPKQPKEKHDTYEDRTWKHRTHTDEEGNIFVPALALKNALENAAIGVKIPGEGQATWTKVFKSGLMVFDNMPLGVHIDDIKGETLFVPSDGKRGGGKRVMKTFPVVPKWKTVATIYVTHPKITPDVLEGFLKDAGNFVGLLRWRPQNGGCYGRFSVEDFQVIEN